MPSIVILPVIVKIARHIIAKRRTETFGKRQSKQAQSINIFIETSFFLVK